MKIAIVGAGILTEHEERDAQQYCNYLLDKLIMEYGKENIVLVSGGAKGIDTIAEKMALQKGLKTKIFHPEVKQWEDLDGKIGYKSRNLQIAKECDSLVCLPAILRDIKCYHCNENHQVGGGCWTMKKAKQMGKETRLMSPIER